MKLSSVIDNIISFLGYNPQSPLLFTSKGFLFLFVAFFAGYAMLKKRFSLRILYVTLFSLYFYYKTGGLYFFIIIFMSMSDFTIGHILHMTTQESRRKMLVALSLVIDLGILCYFKYIGFFAEIFDQLFHERLSIGTIFLPVGISFFTFQSISYVVDIYRQKVEPVYMWIDYLFYLSFFPQLVAGPIVRARDFIPQIKKSYITVSKEMFGMGIFLILLGLVKKSIISDYLSINFVDRIFEAPLMYSGLENLLGVYGYALQIYCDFSGYSDMAIGIALLLGFQFPLNFNTPYKSATPTEFWHRWHISLSSWLRDYLYIPLGGNRKGKIRTYINLMLTMLIGGLWHGAAWNFILWGGLHGLALALHKGLISIFPSMKVSGREMNLGWRVVGTIITFNFVCFCWIFFRADTMDTAQQMLDQIFMEFNIALLPQVLVGYRSILLMMFAAYFVHLLPESFEKITKDGVIAAPLFAKAVVVVMVIWCVMQFQTGEIQPFIYFQF